MKPAKRYVKLDEPKIAKCDWTKPENRYTAEEAKAVDAPFGWGMMVLDDLVVWDFDSDTYPVQQVIQQAMAEGLFVYKTPRGWKIWGKAHPKMPAHTAKAAVLMCGLGCEVYRSDSPRYHVIPVKPQRATEYDWYVPMGHKRVYVDIDYVETWLSEAAPVSDELFRYLNYARWGIRGTGAGGGVKIELDNTYVAKGMRHNFLFVVARHFAPEYREDVIRMCNEVVMGDKLNERELRQEIMAARRGYKTDKLMPMDVESEVIWGTASVGSIYDVLKDLNMLPSYPMGLSIIARRRILKKLVEIGLITKMDGKLYFGGKEIPKQMEGYVAVAQALNAAIEPYDLLPSFEAADIAWLELS